MKTPLIDLGFISVSGPQALQFLQGQLTCDVREISPTQSHLGAYCNSKGKVVVIFRIFLWQDQYILALPKAMLEKTLTILKKYSIFSKVTIEDASHLMAALGIEFKSEAEMNPFNSDLSKLKIDDAKSDQGLIYIPIADPPLRFEIYGAIENIQRLNSTLDVAELPLANWHLHNIEALIPIILPATSEQFTPHMLNLPQLNAVSFKKGCYLGQEIIARTEYLGQAKRHLSQFMISSSHPPVPNDPMMENDKEIGRILIAEKIEIEQYKILAVVSI